MFSILDKLRNVSYVSKFRHLVIRNVMWRCSQNFHLVFKIFNIDQLGSLLWDSQSKIPFHLKCIALTLLPTCLLHHLLCIHNHTANHMVYIQLNPHSPNQSRIHPSTVHHFNQIYFSSSQSPTKLSLLTLTLLPNSIIVHWFLTLANIRFTVLPASLASTVGTWKCYLSSR